MPKPVFILFLLLTDRLFAQNLVTNASFEHVNICIELKQPCSPSGWFYITHKPIGYLPKPIAPAVGNRLLRIMLSNSYSSRREYWQTMLLCPLRAGVSYDLQVKVRSEQNINLGQFGFYFANAKMINDGDTLLEKPGHDFRGATMKQLNNGWTILRMNYTASGSEQWLIIGNFSKDTVYDRFSFVDIDDVRVIPADKQFCAEAVALKDSLYRIKNRHQEISEEIIPPKPVLKKDTIVLRQIEFAFDRHELKNKNVLRPVFALLDKGVKKLEITGYTDNKGSVEYNLSLSRRRADEIARLIKEYMGENNIPIEATGKGISNTYATDDLNRRVEIVIYREQ